MKKILVIGGSYFLGKHFVELASQGNDITIFNRGTRPLNMDGVRELIGDRSRKEDLEILKTIDYDIVVDFCAYNPGDISTIISASGPKLKQYIFISTVDVYSKGTNSIIDENSPLETRDYGGEVGQYISGKVALEHELVKSCSESNIAYSSIRPVIIYGPDNYAPREGVYFNWIDKAGQVLAPEDESGYFQMVYVDDLASVIYEVCGNENYYDRAVNVCSEKIYNYKDFLEAIREGCQLDFEVISIPVADILEKGIELPFPITSGESEEYSSLYDIFSENKQTSLAEGLRKTYECVKR